MIFLLQGLRYNKAHVTHPELKATFYLPIIGVKKNPTSPLYTTLGVLTKGTIIEVGIHPSIVSRKIMLLVVLLLCFLSVEKLILFCI